MDQAHDLRRVVGDLERQPAIAIDTEANPMFAYRERLCLIQISTRRRDYVVDPLGDLDIGELAGVFADVSIVKVLHGAEYDVLQLKRARPFEIRGLFDTRVAAASLGFESPSLAGVLDRYLGVTVDKAHQRSDWGRRPLSDGQLEYARDDTRHLLELYEMLRDDLYDAGRPHPEEVAAECRRVEMLIPESLVTDPDDWIRIKGATTLDPTGQRVLRDLNRFRHRLAEERDRPLFKVLPNDVLMALAKARPRTEAAARRLRGVPAKLVERHAADFVRVVGAALERGPLKRRPRGKVSIEDDLTRDQRAIYEAIRKFRKSAAERRRTDATLILTRQTMVDLARRRPVPTTVDHLAASGLLEPWRLAEYGDALASAIASRG